MAAHFSIGILAHFSISIYSNEEQTEYLTDCPPQKDGKKELHPEIIDTSRHQNDFQNIYADWKARKLLFPIFFFIFHNF